jgi:GrpB-like predicted nucleotidyltransferase (UPF0157 family)
MSAPIIIENYDAHWPEQFEVLRSRIAPVLAALAAAIEHIGSTAVPGLAAKPIIDIDVLLRSTADLPEAITLLAILGYQHRGDLGVPGREAFRPPPNDLPHHLYVCVPECVEYTRHVTFRNHLRRHHEEAHSYERLKRALAVEYRNDREAYNLAKTAFVEAVLQSAAMMEHSAPAGRIIP